MIQIKLIFHILNYIVDFFFALLKIILTTIQVIMHDMYDLVHESIIHGEIAKFRIYSYYETIIAFHTYASDLRCEWIVL